MKQITIRVDKYGKISNTQDLYLKFGNENLTTEVTVDFEGVKEWYNDYVKYAYIFVGKTKRGTFYTSTGNTLTFLLTQEDLQTGYITIQPAAKLPNANPELIKHVQWEHIRFDIKKSFDPITQDTTVTLSLAQILQNEIDQLELSKADKTYVDSQDLVLSNRIGSNDDDILNLQNSKMNTDGLNSNISLLNFNTEDVSVLSQIGQLHWNIENRTLEVRLSNDVTLSLGQEQFIRGRNNQGSPMSNGKVFYISGTTGVNAQFRLATNADTEISRRTIGVLTEDFGTNDDGYGCTNGIVNDINTSMFNGGDLVYLGTNGNLTNIEPTGDAIVVCIGVVLRSHINQGRIYVSPKCVPTLDRLSRVTITNKQNGDVLIAQGNQWVNSNIIQELLQRVEALENRTLEDFNHGGV